MVAMQMRDFITTYFEAGVFELSIPSCMIASFSPCIVLPSSLSEHNHDLNYNFGRGATN